MIDRKAFWIAGLLIAAMLAAALWRVSLLADWTQMPRYGAGGVMLPPVTSLVLFLAPGMLILSLLLVTARARLVSASAPEQELRPWRGWMRIYLIPYSVIVSALQTFFILRSLGLAASVNPVLIARAAFVVAGLLMMVLNNLIPKLPWLGLRIAFLDLDPDSGAKLLRIRGRLGFAFGLLVVLAGALLPLRLMTPIIFAMVTIVVAITLWYRAAAKRGRLQ